MSAKKTFRSHAWFARQDKNGFYYRSWLKNRGFPQDQFDGRPVIGICNTWSDLTPCNTHFKTIADHVRWGVLEAGGFPLEFPVMSLGETLLRPTAMLYRNLASMDVEESIRANPLDGVVLLMGCDKTTPALLMGAASVDVPAIGISAGPMLRGVYRGAYIGSGTNTISMSEQLRAGEITLSQYHEAEACMHRSHGTCMTMGTASTMACLVEALGMGLPGNAAIPAVDARRNLLARESGRRIVEMVKQDVVMSKILTRHALENAVRVNAGIGGSTNAVVHLLSGVAAKSRPEAVVENIIEGHKVASWGHEEPGFLLTCAECGRVLINPNSADWEDVAFVHRWASTVADEKPPRARPPQSYTNSRKV